MHQINVKQILESWLPSSFHHGFDGDRLELNQIPELVQSDVTLQMLLKSVRDFAVFDSICEFVLGAFDMTIGRAIWNAILDRKTSIELLLFFENDSNAAKCWKR